MVCPQLCLLHIIAMKGVLMGGKLNTEDVRIPLAFFLPTAANP
jgi:hypothetical protein